MPNTCFVHQRSGERFALDAPCVTVVDEKRLGWELVRGRELKTPQIDRKGRESLSVVGDTIARRFGRRVDREPLGGQNGSILFPIKCDFCSVKVYTNLIRLTLYIMQLKIWRMLARIGMLAGNVYKKYYVNCTTSSHCSPLIPTCLWAIWVTSMRIETYSILPLSPTSSPVA